MAKDLFIGGTIQVTRFKGPKEMRVQIVSGTKVITMDSTEFYDMVKHIYIFKE